MEPLTPGTSAQHKEARCSSKTWISTEQAGEPAPPQRRFDMVAVLFVVAMGAGLRLYRIGAQPLWVDEASSLRFARQTLAQLWSWSSLVDPGNPPLYYSLLHGWLVFGDSETALRLLSALFGVLTIPLVYALGRTIRDHRLGIVERAPVRDLPVPGLVLTGGARVFPPRARGDGGDVGSRLRSFAPPSGRGACARVVGRGSPTWQERRSRSSRTTRPSSCRSARTR